MTKRILFYAALAAAFTVASCNKIVPDIEEVPADASGFVTDDNGNIVFTAVFGDDEEKTKTQRESDGTVTWKSTDKINVFVGGQSGQVGGTMYSNTADAGALATFTGSAPSASTYIALYPYDENARSNGTTITTTLPAVQTAKENTFDDNLFITMAKAENTSNLSFYNLCGGVKFNVPVEGIAMVELSGNGAVLAGDVTAGFDSEGYPTVISVANSSTSIKLYPPEGEDFFKTTCDYYIVALPANLGSSFKLTFHKFATYQEVTKTVSDWQFEVKRSIFGTIALTPSYMSLFPDNEGILFKDEKFKQAIRNVAGISSPEISRTQAAAVTSLDFTPLVGQSAYQFSDMDGINYFTNLTSLNSADPAAVITGVNLQYNTELTSLTIKGLATDIDLGYNRKLTTVTLNAVANTPDIIVDESGASIANMNLTNAAGQSFGNISITNCNNLNNLTVAGGADASRFAVSNTSVRQLSVTLANRTQSTVYSAVDVSQNRYMTDLSVNFYINEFNCTGSTAVRNCSLTGYGSNFYLNLSSFTNLEHVDVYNFKSLNLSACSKLNFVDIENLTEGVILPTSAPSLSFLWIHNTGLTSLSLPSYSSLSDLNIYGNRSLASLNIASCTNLYQLDCHDCALTALDVSANTKLTDLDCSGNQITSLNIRGLSRLGSLDCSPMNNAGGTNVLSTLLVNSTQIINGVTQYRSSAKVPDATRIVTDAGSSEITYDEIWL